MPDVADFKTRFPEFDAIDDVLVDAVLIEAANDVGALWVETDRPVAIFYLAAHLLASQGLGTSASAGGLSSTSGAVKTMKVGDVMVTRQSVSEPGSSRDGWGSYGRTVYGLRYLELARRSFPAIEVVF